MIKLTHNTRRDKQNVRNSILNNVWPSKKKVKSEKKKKKNPDKNHYMNSNRLINQNYSTSPQETLLPLKTK